MIIPPPTTRLILASSSESRKLLIKKVGPEIECQSSGYIEEFHDGEDPEHVVQRLASGKANFIADRNPNSIIIGADSVIYLDGQIFGKPKDLADAKRIIGSQSGREISATTGISIIKTNEHGKVIREIKESIVSKFSMKKLSTEEIDHLANVDKVLTYAGAICIEGESGKFIDVNPEDIDNIMGLPTEKIKEFLAKINEE